ncbi:MAG: PQQ-dependent dehydrogenase, methanol/ethanol family [Hyphomonadaceae bacterium]|nr:PQQ-dependent dehydrogenase, methanol/ethanol family [Hyphomonadaceae bacterium]
MKRLSIAAALAILALAACGPRGPAAVDAARIERADPVEWLSYGRTYDEQRHSPLDRINKDTVPQLGLAWSYELATNRGVETTPIVVDGVMYVTSAWSVVYALDAKTGAEKWVFDPEVPRAWGQYACCDVVNRGVAVWGGKVFVGALDGRLIALDAADGAKVWEVDTINKQAPYTITGAPRVVKGNVIIGNGGGEYGVRGYVSAYDADDGAMKWRFYTVPGDPAKGPDGAASDSVFEKQAATWTGEWWRYGGGGTVWDSMAYDPALDQLYIGVGNGSPWNQQIRSPGGGDNLFLSSIVALDPDTGEYKWHYQTTPGETWDYTATQTIILADLKIDGRDRKVLMQAPKNGFFYVIDRTNGEFISAKPYVTTTWASGVDAKGRPIENPAARYADGNPAVVLPSAFGGHNWHPMAFSPQTGLAYIPAQELPGAYMNDAGFQFRPTFWNNGQNAAISTLPNDSAQLAAMRAAISGKLSAWDPVTQTEKWKVDHTGPWNGGILSTGGGLVFQGTADGRFVAYDAATGAKAWESVTHSATLAGPMTYEIDGEQYVAVASGFGSVYFLVMGFNIDRKAVPINGRILVYKLGATGTVPPVEAQRIETPRPPVVRANVQAGALAYQAQCVVCHGYNAIGAGVIPDLRHSAVLQDADLFRETVMEGARSGNGMPAFAQVLKPEDSENLRAYIAAEAGRAYAAERGGAGKGRSR